MLDKRSMYIICLFHKANSIFQNTACKSNVSNDMRILNEYRLRSYLTGSRPLANNLDDDNIVELLEQLNEIIDTLSLTKEKKKEFPRNLYQFKRSFKFWLADMGLTV